MDNLKALKKQLKEDIITYDCIDYVAVGCSGCH